jgi:hypothetical protein
LCKHAGHEITSFLTPPHFSIRWLRILFPLAVPLSLLG